MKRQEFLSITDFAKFSRTTRDTLLYYDSIGILSPSARGKNNYRYYSHGQLAIVNLIRTFQALGMSLTQIKNLADFRTPALVEEVLGHQIARVDEKIDEWVRARKLLQTLQGTIRSAMGASNEITVQFMPAEAIVLGKLNDYSRGRDDYDALLSFYKSCSEEYPDMDLNYPAWGMFSKERLSRRDVVWPDRYYFYNPDGHDKKNAALYAVGYKNAGYGQVGDLYERLQEYIDSHGLEACGPIYEEYPLNEICVPLEKDYLARVLVTVREK